MLGITRNIKQGHANEKGFSLVVVLFFVGLIAALVAMSSQGQRGAVQRDQARAAGWHLAQVSKAARIYVRDRSLTAEDPYHKTVLAGGGIAIPVEELRAAGLLPENFPNTNILGQAVRVYAANYPVNGNPANHSTIASAYVFLEDARSTRNNLSLIQYIVEGGRQNGLFVNAPLFSADGTNISNGCRGTPAYASWDTGCLNIADVGMITGGGFNPGALIVPAWRADIPDTRAVMRFPQPENTGYATMMTALEMAPVDRNVDRSCVDYVQIYDYSAGNNPINTGLCRSWSDGVSVSDEPSSVYDAALDHRKDIINVSQMTVDTIVATPQNINAAYGTRDMSFRYDGANTPAWNDEYRSVTQYDYAEVIHITGNLSTDGNVVATGRMANPANDEDGTPLFPVVGFANTSGTSWSNLSVDHNVNASNDMTIRGVSNVRQALAGTLDNALPGSRPATILGQVDAATINTGSIDITPGPGGYATAVMNVNDNNIQTQTAEFFTSVTANQSLNVSQDMREDDVPATVVYRLQGPGNVSADSVVLGGSLAVNSSMNIQGTTSINTCAGGSICPDITPPPGRPLD